MKIGKMFHLDTIETEVGSDDRPKPLCPHCDAPLATVVSHRSDYLGLANLHVFSCPSCRKALGVSTPLK
jgi:hypothetical protein